MLIDDFKSEITTLKPFFETHCQNHQNKNKIDILYDNTKIDNIYLCDECKSIFLYATSRLKECNETPKPKCRKCKNNCYDKDMYKKIAKIMASSGMKLGLRKLKNIFKS